MKMNALHNITADSLLRPKALSGMRMEYAFCDRYLLITDVNQMDACKRRIEIPWDMLGRFISELQEVERITLEEAKEYKA